MGSNGTLLRDATLVMLLGGPPCALLFPACLPLGCGPTIKPDHATHVPISPKDVERVCGDRTTAAENLCFIEMEIRDEALSLIVLIVLGSIAAASAVVWAKALEWWEARWDADKHVGLSKKFDVTPADSLDSPENGKEQLLKQLNERHNPLHFLVRKGQIDALAEVLNDAEYYFTALESQLDRGFLSVGKKAPLDCLVNAKAAGMTLLMTASYHGRGDIVELLLQYPETQRDALDAKTKSTALTWAALGHFYAQCLDKPDETEEWVVTQLQKGADAESVHIWQARWKEVESITSFLAVGPRARDHLAIIQLLKDPALLKSDSGLRAVEYAILANDLPLAQTLIQQGALQHLEAPHRALPLMKLVEQLI